MSRKAITTEHKPVKIHLRLPLELVAELDRIAETKFSVHGLRGGRRQVLRHILYEALGIKRYAGPQARLQQSKTRPLAVYMRRNLFLRPIEDRICLLILKGYGWTVICRALTEEGWPNRRGGTRWYKQQAKAELKRALFDVTRHRTPHTPFYGEDPEGNFKD